MSTSRSPPVRDHLKEKTWFAYSDKEKNDIVAALEGKKCDVQRPRAWARTSPI